MKKKMMLRLICAALVICFAICGLTACGDDKKDAKEETKAAATEKATEAPTAAPTVAPTKAPATEAPTKAPATEAPTDAPVVDTPDDNNNGNNDGGYDDGGDDDGIYEVDRQDMPNCDGSGHGYYIITWSDGNVTTEEY